MVLAAGGGLLDGWGGMVNRWSGHLTTGFEPSTQPPYTAAATMPTHEGRFNTVAGLLAATPPRLRLLDSSLPDDAERAAVRSCCAGTLASCIAQLDAAIAPHAVRMMDGRLPTSDAFRGDDHDLSKLKALKTVATMVLQDGPMLYREACASLVHARSTFFSDLNAALDADVFDSAFRFRAPSPRADCIARTRAARPDGLTRRLLYARVVGWGVGGYGPAGQRRRPVRVGGYGRGARAPTLPYHTPQKVRTQRQSLRGVVEPHVTATAGSTPR